MSTNSASTRSLTRRSGVEKQKSGLAIMYAAVAVILALFTTSQAFAAWRTPQTVEVFSQVPMLTQAVAFDHYAEAAKSTLYPAGGKLRRQTKYLVKITEGLRVPLKVTISAPEGTNYSGTVAVLMTLSAGDLWSKDFTLLPASAFTHEAGETVLDTVLDIPVHSMLTFAAQVGKETEISPGSYLVTLKPIVKTSLESAEEGATDSDFRPYFIFELNNREIIPRGLSTERSRDNVDVTPDLQQQKTTSAKTSQLVNQMVRLFGWNMPVNDGRGLFSLLAFGFVGLSIKLCNQAYRDRPRLSELERITQRHGSKLIKVKSGAVELGVTVLHVANFAQLLAIAEETEKRILWLPDLDGESAANRFAVQDGTLAYCFTLYEQPSGVGENE